MSQATPTPPSGHVPAPGAALPDHFFEMYSMAVEMADRISARRLAANSFFVTAVTGLAVLLGSAKFPWYVAIACILLSVVWWGMLRSYRDLNEAKFVVIHRLEKSLPVAVYTEEWEALKRESAPFSWQPGRFKAWLFHYRELGQLERVVPLLFSAIFVIELIVSLTTAGSAGPSSPVHK